MVTAILKHASQTLFLAALLIVPFKSSAKSIHNAWNSLLTENVVAINNGHSTVVNYTAMRTQHKVLKSYLDSLSEVTQPTFDRWDKKRQLAFLINAYNAWTVELIVTNLVNDNQTTLKSIKDLGGFFSSPWSKEFVYLLGEKRSLDNIEHDLIRGAVDREGNAVYNDPRIHFAVNCASIGCPALREEAYTADNLEAQLQAQTIRFLSDATRNNVQSNTINLSSIFKWYGEDFEKGFRNSNTLEAFLLQYSNALKLTDTQQSMLKDRKMKIKFLDYNWNLNAQH